MAPRGPRRLVARRRRDLHERRVERPRHRVLRRDRARARSPRRGRDDRVGDLVFRFGPRLDGLRGRIAGRRLHRAEGRRHGEERGAARPARDPGRLAPEGPARRHAARRVLRPGDRLPRSRPRRADRGADHHPAALLFLPRDHGDAAARRRRRLRDPDDPGGPARAHAHDGRLGLRAERGEHHRHRPRRRLLAAGRDTLPRGDQPRPRDRRRPRAHDEDRRPRDPRLGLHGGGLAGGAARVPADGAPLDRHLGHHGRRLRDARRARAAAGAARALREPARREAGPHHDPDGTAAARLRPVGDALAGQPHGRDDALPARARIACAAHEELDARFEDLHARRRGPGRRRDPRVEGPRAGSATSR